MKKEFFLLILTGLFVFSLPAEELDGLYKLEPFIIVLPDGRLIHPEKPYAGQYYGIVEMHFLQGSFVRLKTLNNEYNGFYDILSGDSENLTVQVQLKTGGVFSLQLVQQSAGSFRYFYKFSSPPFLENPETGEENPPDVLARDDTPASPQEDISEGESVEASVTLETEEVTLITGIMRKPAGE